MSLTNGQVAWSTTAVQQSIFPRSLPHLDDGPARRATPVDGPPMLMPEASIDSESESRRAIFADIYRKTQERVSLLFTDDGQYDRDAIGALWRHRTPTPVVLPPTTDHEPIREPLAKKVRRNIDEDDYDDDEDEEEQLGADRDRSGSLPAGPKPAATTSGNGMLLSPSKSGSSPLQSVGSPGNLADKAKGQQDPATASAKNKTESDTIKQLEEDRLATEEAARRSFHTVFYTLENDRTAMLEQQQLEDSEKQLQAEMDHNGVTNGAGGQAANHSSLSSANLGASSLTLKHLIARIDLKRDQVRASDAELRLLMNEVRKNRSKWANEDNVNQEELYEALEKVLNELKAHTEYSTPFLTRVNKRDAPDYYNFIKNPMDLGSMTKKLKSLSYKSKADFVTDLNLIWDNCLKYNSEMNHHLRRMANGMRKEAEKLVPLIPELVVRPRAEVEAEERRKQNGGEDDGNEDSDDEPIMSSRGRKATTKGATTTMSRKTRADEKEDTPVVDQKPMLQLNGLLGKPGREGSEAVDGSNGFATPPIGGTHTPNLPNGVSAIGSNADAMDMDGPSLEGMTLNQAFGEAAEQVFESEEYKMWKQTTKKDRALAARQRYLMFKEKKLNTDLNALLRSKAGIRRFLKDRREAEIHNTSFEAEGAGTKSAETLADGIDEDSEQLVPDYYNVLNQIPDIRPKLLWTEDSEGQVINHHEEFLRLLPTGLFVATPSALTKKLDENVHQIQETRRLITKIGVIKQMQTQTQVYVNQFPKPSSGILPEEDIEGHFIADDGPVMAPETCQIAFKRSIGKILYHAGFEELQPSAVDTLTSIAEDYFQKVIKTFNVYREAEKTTVQLKDGERLQSRFSPEEVILHTLDESGHDVNGLETYVNEDIERLGSKLGTIHERMRLYLADLLRPALAEDAGADGAGVFRDGSDQFVSGDFADDLGEDFFGFKALGLDKEMGLDTLAVPFHLLQSRVHNQYQMQTQRVGSISAEPWEVLERPEPVTKENIDEEIGLMQEFFLAKLEAAEDQTTLVEDEDLPPKQRKPRPRLGATGKISSAQRRPPREQSAINKKKKRELEDGRGDSSANTPVGQGSPPPETPGEMAEAKEDSAENPAENPAENEVENVNENENPAEEDSAENPAISSLARASSMERTDSAGSFGLSDKEDGNDLWS